MNFFPIFAFICQTWRFLHNVMPNIEKVPALHAIWNYFALLILCKKKMENFSVLRAIWKMSWRFLPVLVWKNREDISIILFQEGQKFGTFGQNIYPFTQLR